MQLPHNLIPVDPDSPTYRKDYRYMEVEKYSKFRGKENKFKDVIDSPVIQWKEKYTKNPEEFLFQIQRISDYMLMNDASIFGSHNPNTHSLLDIANKGIKEKEYGVSQYFYGVKDPIPYEDFNFFHSSRSRVVGEVFGRNLEFHTKILDGRIKDDLKRKSIDLAAKYLMNIAAQDLTERGVNVGFLVDENINTNISQEDFFYHLDFQQQFESVVDKMLRDTEYRHNLRDLAGKAFGVKFDVNAEFAFIDVDERGTIPEVIPRYVSPDNVRFITTKRDRQVETLDDESIIATSVIDYININQLVMKYGKRLLSSGTGIKSLYETINKIKDKTLGLYDKDKPYFTEYYNASGFRSDYTKDIWNEEAQAYNVFPGVSEVDYMRDLFYPSCDIGKSLTFSVLEHKMFFKVLKEKKFIADIDGKPASRAMLDAWRKNEDYSKTVRCSFREVGEDEKVPKGYAVEYHNSEELWTATRLGHGCLINIEKYKWGTKKENGRERISMPIIGQISYDKSFAALGYPIAKMINEYWHTIDTLTITLGRNTAFVIDKALGMDAASTVYNARKYGVVEVDSSKAKGGGGDYLSSKVLSSIQLGNEIGEILELLNAIGMLKSMYEEMVGIGREVQGVGSQYNSQGQQATNIANQSILRAKGEHEHNMFLNQVFRKVVDIRKSVIPEGVDFTVLLSEGEVEVLRLLEGTSSAEMNVHVYNGYDLKQKAERIRAIAEQMASSGGIERIEDLIEIIYTDNPMKHLAIIKKSSEIVRKQQEQMQKIQSEEIQAKMQAEQMKMQVPIEVKNIDSQTKIQLQQMQSADRDTRDEEKGLRDYEKYENQFKSKLMDAEIRAEEKEHDAEVQAKLMEQQKAIDYLFNMLGAKPKSDG